MNVDPLKPLPGEDTTQHATNPLGGRVHRSRRDEAAHRHWSGFVAHVRICPKCGWENDERAMFCVSCAADIRNVPTTASSDSRPGVAVLEKRLRRERRQSQRTRAMEASGGGGWIAFGAILVVVVLVVGPDRTISAAAWLVAMASAVFGLWCIRRDQQAMRVWGSILAGSAALILVFVGFRAIQASDAFNEPNPASLLATPSEIAQSIGSEATPSPAIAGTVSMVGGGPGHDGVMPGPAPLYFAGALVADGHRRRAVQRSRARRRDPLHHQQVRRGLRRGRRYRQRNLAARDHLIRNPRHSLRDRWRGLCERRVHASPHSMRRLAKQLWSIPLQYGGHASPTVLDGILTVSSQQGWMYGISAKNGEMVWRIPTEGIVFGATAMAGDSAIYGTDEGVVYSASVGKGTMHWRTIVSGAIYASPVISGNTVLVSTQSGETFALDLETGDRLWTSNQGGANAPATNGDIVIIAADDGGVYGLDLATGEQRWLYPGGKATLTTPVITGDLAIFGAGNSLLAVDIYHRESRLVLPGGRHPRFITDCCRGLRVLRQPGWLPQRGACPTGIVILPDMTFPGRPTAGPIRQTPRLPPQSSLRCPSLECTVERNSASNWDGAKYTPRSSRALKKRLNLPVSLSLGIVVVRDRVRR